MKDSGRKMVILQYSGRKMVILQVSGRKMVILQVSGRMNGYLARFWQKSCKITIRNRLGIPMEFSTNDFNNNNSILRDTKLSIKCKFPHINASRSSTEFRSTSHGFSPVLQFN